MFRKFLLLLLLFPITSYTQCAMCKAVVENGDSDMATGINSGIIYLMVFPYLFLTIAAYFLFKKFRKNKKTVT